MPPSTTTTGRRAPTGAVALTVLSIACVQVSDALSVPLLGRLGAPGTAWLRTTTGALLLLVLVRPALRSVTASQWRAIVPLGAAAAVLSLAFLGALRSLPLGTAVAIEFLGPLALAVRGTRRHGLLWPGAALAGVLLLTRPWTGDLPLAGVALAGTAAGAWAACIVLTVRVGRRVEGLRGVALAVPVAALCLTPWGAAPALTHLDPGTALHALGLAVLLPVLPFVLELLALRHLPTAGFAVLMALEPALGAGAGLLLLQQGPGLPGLLGTALVVAAGTGVCAPPKTHHPHRATHRTTRHDPAPDPREERPPCWTSSPPITSSPA